MSAWLLPDHIADVLPNEARQLEELRRGLLDTARSHGYELVMPPLVEYLDSLLTGTGQALDLQTFKLVDQLSGRMLGVRADTTPQVARIDAHLLSRNGLARLCYCGPVLHARPEGPHASREPLQLGAELYGCSGRAADLEILSLALECLRVANLDGLRVDLADARIVRALLAEIPDADGSRVEVHQALASKDASALRQLGAVWPASVLRDLLALIDLYGGAEVLQRARAAFAGHVAVQEALDDLDWLTQHLGQVEVGFDLSDARGWGYYTGPRFAAYARGAGSTLLRGGRYDGVGAVFGTGSRSGRPAVGFSLDLKQLARAVAPAPAQRAIRAPWRDDRALLELVTSLRRQGETVVYALPGHEDEAGQLEYGRELVWQDGRWQLSAS